MKVPKRIDVSKLQNSEVHEALRNTFDNIDVGGSWKQFKTQVYTAAVDVLGFRKTNQTGLMKRCLNHQTPEREK